MHINKARAASSADVPDDSPEQRPGQPAPTGAPQLQNASTGAPPAFFDAARSGDVGTLATLLATREARPTDVEPKSGMTALMLAVLRAQPSVVALLVDRRDAGSFINAPDGRGNTPLYLARAAGHEDIVALLEEAGAKEGATLTSTVSLTTPGSATTASSETTTSNAQTSTTIAAEPPPSAKPATAATSGQPKPATLLQAVEQGDAPALRAMLAELKAAGKDLAREVNRYGACGRLLCQPEDPADGYVIRRIDAGAKAHGWEPLFSTPLNVAAALGDENCVDVLLAAGADVELKDMVGPSMVWAARSGHAGIIARLAAAGVEINGTDCRVLGTWGRTPLAIAAMRGHVDAVRALLQAGAKPDSRSPGAGTHADDRTWSWTPLMYAARGGHAEVVKTLIAARANVHAKTTSNRGDVLYRKGTSVLMIAAMYGRAGVVRRLIAAGANVNDADDSGCSALLLACTRGCDAATVKLLIDAGASRKFSKPGTTASSLLGEAARYATPEIIDALMQAGERFVYGMGFYGSTLEAAIVYPQRAANVAAYVRHGVDVNRPDLFGKTPLMLAAAGWHDAMLQALIEAGADVNLKNAVAYMPHPGGAMNADYGYTALMEAARHGTPGGIRLLLRAGALTDTCSPDGRTALMHAVANARTDNVRALLQGGADCRRKSLAGETALGIAKGFGLLEVALMLQQHMASQ